MSSRLGDNSRIFYHNNYLLKLFIYSRFKLTFHCKKKQNTTEEKKHKNLDTKTWNNGYKKAVFLFVS